MATPKDLRYVELPVIEQSRCRSILPNIRDSNICTFYAPTIGSCRVSTVLSTQANT